MVLGTLPEMLGTTSRHPACRVDKRPSPTGLLPGLRALSVEPWHPELAERQFQTQEGLPREGNPTWDQEPGSPSAGSGWMRQRLGGSFHMIQATVSNTPLSAGLCNPGKSRYSPLGVIARCEGMEEFCGKGSLKPSWGDRTGTTGNGGCREMGLQKALSFIAATLPKMFPETCPSALSCFLP